MKTQKNRPTPTPTIKRRRRRRTQAEDQLPKWAIKYLSDIAEKTGFTRDRVLDDLLKAGAVALKDRYRSIVNYRESVEQLWSQPLGKVEPPSTPAAPQKESDVETSIERIDWSPDLDLSGRGEPAPQNSRVGHTGFDAFEIGPGQLAQSAADLESVESPNGEPAS